MIVVEINGVECQLATTLRVAYMVQGQHNHKPYSEIFEDLGEMCLEDQIGILYVAYKVGTPEGSLSRQQFLDYYLDNFNLKYVMDQIKQVVQGITGQTDQTDPTEVAPTEIEGN